MSHEIEMVNGQAQMAYVGEVPWHGLGERVPADLSPRQMMEKAGCDWEVKKVPTYAAPADDDLIATGGTALAAVSLLRSVGAEVIGAGFVIDLPDLGGSAALRDAGIHAHSLVEFPGH